MSGYQTFEALRPILHQGPPAMPVVNRSLVRPNECAPVAVVARSERRDVTVPTVKRMRALRAEGESLRAIARICGCKHTTVLRHVRDVPPPETGWKIGCRPSAIRRPLAEQMRRAGFTYAEIGEQFGVAESTAHYALYGSRTTPLAGRRRVARLVQAVARVSGIPAEALRAAKRGRIKKGSASTSKARALLFWLIYRHTVPIASTSVGASLGGFQGTTVMDGVRRTDAIVAALGLAVVKPKDALRTLWQADWSVIETWRQR